MSSLNIKMTGPMLMTHWILVKIFMFGKKNEIDEQVNTLFIGFRCKLRPGRLGLVCFFAV